jgi:hypothetical protein
MNAMVPCDGDREYGDDVDELRSAEPALAGQIAHFRGIDDVLTWMQDRHLTSAAVGIIGQDEFNYDFLIQLERDGRWISFGVT